MITTCTLPGDGGLTVSRPLLLVLTFTMGLLGIGPNAAVAQPDQSRLAQSLLRGDRTERFTAAETARTMGREGIGPELYTALIQALLNEGAITEQRRRGEIGYYEHPELIARLAMVVSRFNDPAAIPALAGALGTSPAATNTLAAYGEPAAQAVLDALARTEDGSVIMDAMTCLRLMVEGSPPAPSLSEETLTRIRAVAEKRLTTPQRTAPRVWSAIDLAIALDDPELRQLVETLAAAADAVRALGVTEPDLVEKTQRWAADRLAGIPGLPRPGG